MRQRLTYARRDLRAPDQLVRAVYDDPTPAIAAEFFESDPELVFADNLFFWHMAPTSTSPTARALRRCTGL